MTYIFNLDDAGSIRCNGDVQLTIRVVRICIHDARGGLNTCDVDIVGF